MVRWPVCGHLQISRHQEQNLSFFLVQTSRHFKQKAAVQYNPNHYSMPSNTNRKERGKKRKEKKIAPKTSYEQSSA